MDPSNPGVSSLAASLGAPADHRAETGGPPHLRHRTIELPAGMALHVAERPGEGAPILFLHCVWGSWRNWLPLLQPEPDLFAGRRMLLIDLRGHGASSKPAAGYRVLDYTADILALIRQEELERLTIVGHSLGALIALLVAGEHPERIEALVLEEPPLPFPLIAADVDDYWLNLGAMTKAYLALKRQPRQIRVETLLTWEPGLWRAEAERFADALADTADGVYQAVLKGVSRGTVIPPVGLRLEVPALVFQAADPGPRALRVRGIAQLRAALPRLEVVNIPRTGHDVLRDNPDSYRETIARWFPG
jgi:pimeloyl-ACP methyl ester carboxylesterase